MRRGGHVRVVHARVGGLQTVTLLMVMAVRLPWRWIASRNRNCMMRMNVLVLAEIVSDVVSGHNRIVLLLLLLIRIL